MLANFSSFSPYGDQTVPTGNGVIAGPEPLGAGLIEELLNKHLTEAHQNTLINDCKIDPEVLVRSKCFSLRNDPTGQQFLPDHGFHGGKLLIGQGLVFADSDSKGGLLGYSILSQESRLDECGRSVFIEESDGNPPRIGVYSGPRVSAGCFDGLIVWATNPIYALIAASKGMAAHHVVNPSYASMTARSLLRQSLHDFDANWNGCESANTHVFLQTGQLKPRCLEFNAMRVIADVVRARGADVMEIQLSSYQYGEEWELDDFGVKPTPQHIQAVHNLLDWVSAQQDVNLSK